MKEIDKLLEMKTKGFLNDKGLLKLCDHLQGKIKNHFPERTNHITEVDNDQVRLDTRRERECPYCKAKNSLILDLSISMEYKVCNVCKHVFDSEIDSSK